MTSDTRKIRILAVDDHALLRKGIAALINAEPDIKLVAEAANGQEAIAEFKKHQPDVTLMDLQMPDMNGLETTAAMRQIPGYETVPILALTADTSDEMRDLCRRQGMQAFLSKPFDKNELYAVISKYLKPDSAA